MANGGADEPTAMSSQHAEGAETTLIAPRKRGRAKRAAVFAPGDQVGRHTVLSTLGEGGFGQVFLAFDENLKRKVALKVLYGETDDAQRQRFRREGEALAALAHPNVVAVYDVVERDGAVVLAMEYVPGQTLTDWAKDRPWREVLGAFLQAARGLKAAHAAGMVHRDFKPDNVLVGADGRARVADFGLAARSQPGDGGTTARGPEPSGSTAGAALDAQLSVDGLVMGTPYYMAPEVRVGDRATGASDQYSYFRALLYLLGGRPRGEGDDDVPGWVDALTQRGLAEQPGERWPDMGAVVAELERRLGVPPELDPRRGARARQVLLGGQMALGLGATALAIGLGGERVLTPKMLLILGVWQFAVALGFIAFGARSLAGSVVGQRVSAVVLLTVTGILGNRGLAFTFEAPGRQTLAVDLVLTSVVLLAAALFVQRWAAGAAAATLGAAALAGAWPVAAPALFLAAICAVLLQALWHLRRPDRLRGGYLER